MASAQEPSVGTPSSEHPAAYGYERLPALAAFGMYLRQRPVVNHVRRHRPASMLDLGCGYRADLLTLVHDKLPTAVGVDLEVDRDHGAAHGLTLLDGEIIATLDTFDAGSFDYITLISVLEHLPDPQAALNGIHRALAPGGTAVVHVPTWLGKPVLEVMAFRMGIGTESIDDHRTYYQIAELWPMVIRAGFRPMHTKMRYSMLGFALRAELRKPA